LKVSPKSPWIWKKNRQSKKARVMIYFESCFSAILYSQTHFCTMLCFSRQFFERKQKNKPNYFWCDHFNFKNHQSSSSSILITKKIINFCIENWHPFLSNLSTHYKQWKIKKMKKPKNNCPFKWFFLQIYFEKKNFHSGII